MRKLLKEWRVWLVIICFLGSLYLIAPTSQKGVVVKSIESDSPFSGKVQVGETISWANENEINSPEDIYQFENFTGTFRFMHSGELDLINIEEPGLGITVSKKPFSRLDFGLDLVGGTRVLLKPKEENVSSSVIQQTIATLETRINVFGLKEANFQSINDISGNKYIQIELAGGTEEEVEELLEKQGKFEGKIGKEITFKNNTGTLEIGDNNYKVKLINGKIEINNSVLSENQSSQIEDIKFEVLNTTNQSSFIMLTVFTGTDIQSVCLQDQPGVCVSRIIKMGGGYQFNFQVFVSQKSSEKFAKITKNMEVLTDPSTGSKYLDGRIYLYLDENLVTSLSISSDLKGKVHTNPAITGFRRTRSEALEEQRKLKSILKSGALPVSLEIIRTDQISAALGKEFFTDAVWAGTIALIAVSVVIYIRYRSFKILIPNMLWSFFELTITLGAASIIGWTIDLSSIAGLIAAIGSGTNDQIMIIDETMGGEEERKIYSLKRRIKRAFFIIFGAAATVIAAMLPLMFVGVGVMKGFAVTTTLGLLIGIIITRPAFGIVVEKLLEKK